MSSKSIVWSDTSEKSMRQGTHQLFIAIFEEVDASTRRISASLRLVFVPAMINSDYNNKYFAYVVWIDPSRTDFPQNAGIAHCGGSYKLPDLKNGISEGRRSIRLAHMHLLVEFNDGFTFGECHDTILRSVVRFPKSRESSSNASIGLLSHFFGRASPPEQPQPLAPLDALYWIVEWTKWLEEGGERGSPLGHILDMVRDARVTRMRIEALMRVHEQTWTTTATLGRRPDVNKVCISTAGCVHYGRYFVPIKEPLQRLDP
ncbi:uncharacterized protein STEHIDRAFT_115791 [Stereum hirsutum FP-91666 SS1]|uniref:Uncharacterized protein n=1 Tax=Stereum hirsutum (strain FP-91666) TaxID=721885 RepID=R7RYB7_STEHR|nr:uncharacterized protein STEHIDRAFT_115791 [Stereum hirsutum FP-91666 SS1]EIM80324.1 hypothetical protein STEHIDRAFT_115791 [Stereum hirsutum FP-91666 SS1]